MGYRKMVVKTGIKGFDRLVKGGFPENKCILLSGTPGTCKTIFALQYIYNGATLFDDKCLYVSFEEKSSALKSQASQFGWDLKKLEDDGKLLIISIKPGDINKKTSEDIVRIVKGNGIKRLVIDSISALAINTPTEFVDGNDITDISIKRFLYHFINDLKDLDSTIILITQTAEGQLSRDTVSEFICDGIVNIVYQPMGGQFSRSIIIRKMREVEIDEDIHPLEITNEGLRIHDLS